MKTTLSSLSTITGLTQRRLRQLREDHILPEPVSGSFDLGECVRALLAYHRKRTAPTDLAAARVRKVSADAGLAEAQLRTIRAELIEREKVHRFLMQCFAAIKQRIMTSSMEREEKDTVLLDLKSLQTSPWVSEADEPFDQHYENEKENADPLPPA